MAVQSNVYPASNTRVYLSSKHIGSKSLVRVFTLDIEGGAWEIMNQDRYELINNSIVLKEIYNGYQLEVRVADTEDELTNNQSEISIIASNIDDINTVALKNEQITTVANSISNVNIVAGRDEDIGVVEDNISEVVIVSNAINSVGIVSGSISSVNTVATNIVDVQNAEENANIAIANATASAVSAGESQTSASNSAISASQALAYKDEAKIFRDEAATYADGATFEILNSNGDVGSNSDQVAIGNHLHTGVYEPADATILKAANIGSTVQAYDADTTKNDVANTFTASQRGTVTTDNDLSFNLNSTNFFKCTPTATGTLTFTNIPVGQSGTIILDNSGGYVISCASTTYISANDLTTINTAGRYVLGYITDGTNVYVTCSQALTSAGV